jgi:transcriptional regulator with XRE-family HTH domain
MDDEEVKRWSHHLRLWMTERGRSQRSVEREVGWGVGYLSQLLRPSPPDLKVRQLLAILRVLQVTPQAFFGGLYSEEDGATEMPPLSREELRDFVSQALREELVRLGTGAGEEEPKKATGGS